MVRILILLLMICSHGIVGQELFTVNIDLGGTQASLPWNILTNSTNGELSDVLAMNGQQTNINIEVIEAFNGTNSNGTNAANADLEIPDFASGDSFFGNQVEWSGQINPRSQVLLKDLDVDRLYDVSLFASRLASDNRETEYRVVGSNIDTLMYLDVADNIDDIVIAKNILPLENGTIRIEATTGPNNTNDFGFFYLGVLRIEYIDTLIVQEPELEITAPTGGEYWQSGKSPDIRWNSLGVSDLAIAYSIDNGDSWIAVDTVSAFSQRYKWTVPNADAQDCLIRLSGGDLTSISDQNFEITTMDTTECHIVVLGSSTAAGTGPSVIDSAWVWRYDDHLFQRDTRFKITNLAKGGFTTYNILPDATPIPMDVAQTIDAQRNITRALSLNPQAILINLPSNDAAFGYSVEDQLLNYDVILEDVMEKEIPFWICTTQPRNGFNEEQKAIQRDMRDSTFIRFDDFAIDFWSGFEDENDEINPLFDTGDGTHLNDMGHRILVQRVLDKGIPQFLIDSKTISTSTTEIDKIERLHVFPNPTSDVIHFKNIEPIFELIVLNSNGEKIFHDLRYDRNTYELLDEGWYYIMIKSEDNISGSWVLKL